MQARPLVFNVFVVDDEPLAQVNLIEAIGANDKWLVSKVFSSARDVLAETESHEPHVIFLDIHMPGESGLSLAGAILDLPNPPLIVFVTAFTEHAVSAFELYAVDYLLKPFDDKRMEMCLRKLEGMLNNESAKHGLQKAQRAWANKKTLDRIVIKSSSSMRIIPVDSVQWIASNGNYVDIHHSDGKHLLRSCLKSLFACLPQNHFTYWARI